MKNKRKNLIISVIVILLIVILFLFIFVFNKSKKVNENNFVKYYNSTTSSGYAKTIFDKLTDGDITSTQCASIAQKLDYGYQDSFKTSKYPRLLISSTYLYKKHRCIGLTNEALNGKFDSVYTEKIIDVSLLSQSANDSYIASCTSDLVSRKDIGMITKCDDIFGNTWNTLDMTVDSTHRSMSPMIRETYTELEKLSEQ